MRRSEPSVGPGRDTIDELKPPKRAREDPQHTYLFEKQWLTNRLSRQSARNVAGHVAGHVAGLDPPEAHGLRDFRAVGGSDEASCHIGMAADAARGRFLADRLRRIHQRPGGRIGHQRREHRVVELVAATDLSLIHI